MADLKPCPFCGGGATFYDNSRQQDYASDTMQIIGAWTIEMAVACKACMYEMSQNALCRNPMEAKSTQEKARETLFKRWNRRLTKAKATTKTPSTNKEDSNDRKPRSRSTPL